MKYATQFTYANVLIQLKMWQQQHAHFTPCFQKVTNPPIANWSRVVQETILEIAWISKRNHLNAASLIVLWLVFVGSNSEIAFDSKKKSLLFLFTNYNENLWRINIWSTKKTNLIKNLEKHIYSNKKPVHDDVLTIRVTICNQHLDNWCIFFCGS